MSIQIPTTLQVPKSHDVIQNSTALPNTISAANRPWSWENMSASVATAPIMHAIEGEMIVARYTMTDMEFSQRPMHMDEIKRMMCQMLVEKLYTSKMIEFTKMQDNISGNHLFHARIYAVPDTKVRILREKS